VQLTSAFMGFSVGRQEIDQAVDSICNQGCQYVNSVLEDSATRVDCNELTQLCDHEQAIVLAELKSVMSVYAKTGSCEV
jgi:hypothetical protein